VRRYKGKVEVLAVASEILESLDRGQSVEDLFAQLKASGVVTISRASFYRQVSSLKQEARTHRTSAAPAFAVSRSQQSRQSAPPPKQPADGAPFAIRRPDFDPEKKAKI
jgi:IS30 family transposase